MGNHIQTNDIEPVYLYLVNSKGKKILGSLDIYIRVLRQSDACFLDFGDNTFKSCDWINVDRILSESNQTNAPGVYELSGGLDTSIFTNPVANDTYLIIPAQSGTAALLPSPESFKVGGWADNLDVNVSSRSSHDVTTVISGTDAELSANHGIGSWTTTKPKDK